MLIFYENIKKNFTDMYSELIKKASTDFNAIDDYFSKNSPSTHNQIEIKSRIDQFKKDGLIPTATAIRNLDRKQLADMISTMNALTSYITNEPSDSPIRTRGASLNNLLQPMQMDLYMLSPTCIDALEWYEYTPGHKPKARC